MTATFDFDRLLESVLDADGPQTCVPSGGRCGAGQAPATSRSAGHSSGRWIAGHGLHRGSGVNGVC